LAVEAELAKLLADPEIVATPPGAGAGRAAGTLPFGDEDPLGSPRSCAYDGILGMLAPPDDDDEPPDDDVDEPDDEDPEPTEPPPPPDLPDPEDVPPPELVPPLVFGMAWAAARTGTASANAVASDAIRGMNLTMASTPGSRNPGHQWDRLQVYGQRQVGANQCFCSAD
jgi:hypothetical protein